LNAYAPTNGKAIATIAPNVASLDIHYLRKKMLMGQYDPEGGIALDLVSEDIDILEEYGYEISVEEAGRMWLIKLGMYYSTGSWEFFDASDY
tara:strand:- start:356 stop:631 length:276 start_codon:yes stop_codon:yes gene_type:complete